MNTPLFLAGKSALWNQCMQHFLQSRRSPRTAELYGRVLRDFFRFPLRLPDAYTQQDILTFLRKPCNSVRNRGGEPCVNTINARFTAIQSFYKFSASYTVPGPDGKPEILLQRPAPTLGLHHLPSLPKPRSLSREQLTAFFRAIDHRDTPGGSRNFALFYCYFVLGLRRSELLRLTWGDIQPCTFIEDGVAREGWRVRILRKARAGHEWIELPGECLAAILRWLEAAGRLTTMQPDDAIFIAVGPGQNGKPCRTRPLDGNTVNLLFKTVCKRAGLDHTKFSPHALRHSSAEQRYLLKPDLLVLAKALGHSSVATTQRYLTGLLGSSDPVSRTLTAAFSDL